MLQKWDKEMDNLTEEQRKRNMQRIRSFDTKAEVILRKALWKNGYRYRKNYKKLPGSPDIVLTKQKVAIFCDGEFFHGKDWETQRKKVLKSNNAEYWISKIERNIERDREVNQILTGMGWTVLRFWSRDIISNPDECIEVIKEFIQQFQYMEDF